MFSSIVRGSKPFAAEQEIRKIKIFFSNRKILDKNQNKPCRGVRKRSSKNM